MQVEYPSTSLLLFWMSVFFFLISLAADIDCSFPSEILKIELHELLRHFFMLSTPYS